MHLTVRALFVIAVLPLTLALSGCGSSGGVWDTANNVSDRFQDMMHDFNPFGTAKKPLPGERRAVFPEGVPGVQQGVPQELVRGNQPVGEPQVIPAPEAAPPPPARSAPKRTAKAKAPARQEPAEAEPSDPPEDGVWPPPPRR